MQTTSGLNATSTGAPALAVTYEGRDPALLERVLPLVGFVEVTPDSLAEVSDGMPVFPDDKLRELEDIAKVRSVILHGVGLSIGSADGASETYLDMLETLFDRVPVRWHSEHLGYVRVDGEHLGTMLALPKTEEMLDIVCERVAKIQQRYPVPFLLENVVHVLPDYPGDYSEAAFLNALTRRTGCGLILDLYNLECDAHNHDFAIDEFLAELEYSSVRELHLAGGLVRDRFKLDVHSRTTDESTIVLARRVLKKAPSVQAVTYELLTEAIQKLGADTIGQELERIRRGLWN